MKTPDIKRVNVDIKFSGLKSLVLTYPIAVYNETGSRILLISDYLPNEDVKYPNRDNTSWGISFLSGKTGEIFGNCLSFAINDTDKKLKEIIAIPSLPVIRKEFYEKTEFEQNNIKEEAYRYIEKIVLKYKPDLVVFSGLWFGKQWIKDKKLLGNEELLPYLRGRILLAKFKDYDTKAITTFSMRYTATNQYQFFKSTVNLLGVFARDLSTAIEGEDKYNLSKVDCSNTETINSASSWKAFYSKLIKANVVSIDTETKNLNRVNDNILLTVQFTFDGETTYILPWRHPQSPLMASEFEIIKKDLVDYFENGKSKFHIYQNAKFDLQQFRRELGVSFFNHRIWDISVGEYFLEENLKFFRDAGIISAYTLDAIAMRYGSFHYLEGNIGKKDRKDMINVPLKDIVEYGAKDVILPFHIAKCQIREAKRRGPAYNGYKNAVLELGSDMIHVFTDMECNGSKIDKKYIQQLLMPTSTINVRLKEIQEKFKDSKAAQQVNQILIKKHGQETTQGLFGTIEPPWLFKINDEKHQQLLFFKILQLTPLEHRKNGDGKLGKLFIAEYKNTVKEVLLLEEYGKMMKIIGTYVKGIYRLLVKDADFYDGRLRAVYKFITILTTRSSASAPNMQAMPSHGDDAKIIKREFIADKGKICIKIDYNAHEVRGWGNISNDDAIKAVFTKGIQLRREFRTAIHKDSKRAAAFRDYLKKVGWFDTFKDEKGKEKEKHSFEERVLFADKVKSKSFYKLLKIILDLEVHGDTHKLNYSRFYDVPPHTVTKLQRQSIKEVVFGVMYGKGAESLSRKLFADEWKIVDKEIESIEANKDLSDEEKWKKTWNAKGPLVKRGKDLIDKLFENLKQGGEWIKETQNKSRITYNAVSPFGAVRHLWGYLHTENTVKAMMDRRAANSIVQGASSNIIYTGSRLMQIICHDLKIKNKDLGYKHTNIVHDSNESEASLITLPITLYYLEHSLTTLVSNKARDTYGWNMPINLELEIELGGAHSRLTKWNFTEEKLFEILNSEIDWMNEEFGYKLNKETILKKAKKNWDVVNTLRIQELEARGHEISPETEMLMKPEKIDKYNLVWS